jgi:sarcosine oxidase subunit gamma
MLERYSALAEALRQGGRDGAGSTRALRLGEVRGWSLVQVAAFATTLPELQRAVQPLLGTELPPRIGEVARAGERHLFKTAATQFWIVGPERDALASALQAAISPEIGAGTPLSHSRTRIFVEGAPARELLGKGIPLDFHPDIFRAGHFALTGLHHTPVLVHRIAQDRYELYAMRTFAMTVWDWLTDAALPFGYDVANQTSRADDAVERD